MSTYIIDVCPKSRGKCTSCKEQIAEGSLRVGLASETKDGRKSVRWRHWECAQEGRVLRNIKDPENLEGLDSLKKSDQDRVRKAFAELDAEGGDGGGSGKAAKASGKASGKGPAKKKAKQEESEEEEEEAEVEEEEEEEEGALGGYTAAQRCASGACGQERGRARAGQGNSRGEVEEEEEEEGLDEEEEEEEEEEEVEEPQPKGKRKK
ncbi:hypothetical protein ABPG77_010964 [Micractinium sp. CCAP 211/92]